MEDSIGRRVDTPYRGICYDAIDGDLPFSDPRRNSSKPKGIKRRTVTPTSLGLRSNMLETSAFT